MHYSKTATVFLSALTIVAPLIAAAQFGGTTDFCSVLVKIFNVVKVFGSVVLVVAVVMLLWAGILFMTGGGNEEKIKQARLILIYSLVGLAVAILATQADDIVKTVFASSFLSSCVSIPEIT